MADDFDPPATNLTLAEALDQYLTSLKNEQRRAQEQYIRHFVKSTGAATIAREYLKAFPRGFRRPEAERLAGETTSAPRN